MNAAANDMLRVPGATLYYEVRGTGPALLLIPGGNGDAGPFERVANELASRYTVVTYDRRGFSRSPLDGPSADEPSDGGRRLEIDSDDAIHLLDRVTERPAFVFGSSSGAIVALDLVTRHPQRIKTLVAHEPPLLALLPDAAKHLSFVDDVYDTFRQSGVEPAMQKFNAGIGLGAPMRPPPGVALPPQLAEMMSRMRQNFGFWLEHELRQYPRIVPDVAALKVVSRRLVLAGGSDSREQVPYRPNVVLAERLGLQVVDFPGGHIGYVTDPVSFASRLLEVMVSGSS